MLDETGSEEKRPGRASTADSAVSGATSPRLMELRAGIMSCQHLSGCPGISIFENQAVVQLSSGVERLELVVVNHLSLFFDLVYRIKIKSSRRLTAK